MKKILTVEVGLTVRNNVTTDWTLRENVRAQLRVLIKHILRRYGYPPNKQEKATETVMEQAEVLSAEWACQQQGGDGVRVASLPAGRQVTTASSERRCAPPLMLSELIWQCARVFSIHIRRMSL